MTPTIKHFLSAGAIVLACGAVVAGTVARDRTDLHLHTFGPFAGHTLLADLSNREPEISAADFYEQVSGLLKRLYVDPITDDRKLATGAVRGMVSSLGDPDSQFMNQQEFKAYNGSEMGRFEGIGVQLGLEDPTPAMLVAAEKAYGLKTTGQPAKGAAPNPSSDGELVPPTSDSSSDDATASFPALVVTAVVPGSPAEKAGVHPGDSVEEVNGYWVMNPYDLDRFVKVQQLFKANMVTSAQYLQVRRDLRKKLTDSIMPTKARDLITLGTSGTAKISWDREGAEIKTVIPRSISNEDAVRKLADGAYAVHFIPGAATHLKSVIGDGPVTLDLRNNAGGDMTEMKDCLALFAPAGVYGRIVNHREKPAKSLVLADGHTPRKLTLVVDVSTGGVAEIFAQALQGKGHATLQGSAMSRDHNVTETERLPDGTGYTLATGVYQPPGAKVALNEPTAESGSAALGMEGSRHRIPNGYQDGRGRANRQSQEELR